jgi:hypothetical protein
VKKQIEKTLQCLVGQSFWGSGRVTNLLTFQFFACVVHNRIKECSIFFVNREEMAIFHIFQMLVFARIGYEGSNHYASGWAGGPGDPGGGEAGACRGTGEGEGEGFGLESG